MVAVNWQLLCDALRFYEGQGYKRVDLPWHTQRKTSAVTCPDPEGMVSLPLKDAVVVGSAEQSFMQEQFDGRLAPGRYVALTPCFRKEPVYDELHHPYFMKVELYVCGEASLAAAQDLMKSAKLFMSLNGADTVKPVPTEEGIDLQINGIEVGSYCASFYEGHQWTCGTGLAEPRFSHAIKLNK